jgi:hypothetical protein
MFEFSLELLGLHGCELLAIFAARERFVRNDEFLERSDDLSTATAFRITFTSGVLSFAEEGHEVLL